MDEGSGFARRVTLQNLQTFAPLLRENALQDADESPDVQRGEDVDLDRANTAAVDPALIAAEALFAGNPLEVKTRHRRRSAARPEIRARGQARVIERAAGTPELNLPVLVAEIPRGGPRWSQANFDLATFERFFGAKVGTRRTIQVQHVGSDGTLAIVEHRPAVVVRSHNYRFELDAGRGLPYPEAGRPIAVFVQQPSGAFLYRLVMPNDSGHGSLARFLDDKWRGRSERMRRIPSTLEELRRYWPDSPLWQALSRA